MHAYRSHTCADLTKANVGDTVRLSGWVHRVRDHGGLLFIDLRDHYGITQVMADPDSPVFAEIEKVRSEWCIRIDGNVMARDESLVNPKIPTGEVEVFIRDIEVLGAANELPLMVFGDQEYPEETRLNYRYLDLRREKMQNNMKLRSMLWPRCASACGTEVPRISRRRSSPRRPPKARATFWCHRVCTPANSTRCRRPPAVQTADHGVGLRQVFPDRPVFP